MCGSDPCPNCEAITTELAETRVLLVDTAKSLLASIATTVGYQHERDAAREALASARALVDVVNNFRPLDPCAEDVLDELRAALEGKP